MGRRAKCLKANPVIGRSVAFVACKMVLRKLAIPFPHHCIARHFCENRGCRNGDADRVASDDRNLRNCKIEIQCVDQQQIGQGIDPQNGLIHGQAGRLQNIDPVDLGRLHACKGPCECPASNFVRQPLSPRRGKLLAVFQSSNPFLRIQNNCCCHNRPEQRSSSHFIETSNSAMAVSPAPSLVPRAASAPSTH